LSCGLVAAQSKRRDVVVERDVKAVDSPAVAAFSETVDQLVAHEPTRLAGNRSDRDRAHRRGDGSSRATAVERVQAARAKRHCGEDGERCAHQATIFTSRSGTTMTLRG